MSDAARSAPRILAVEDDLPFARHLLDHLRSTGYAVTHSADGLEGLRLVEQEEFDLVLMDIMLPGASGLDVLQRIRRERAVPVMLMSALGNEQDRISGFSQGADDYLPKPFSLDELSVRIEAILRRVAYERQARPSRPVSVDLVFDDVRNDVGLDGRWAGLTPSEYRVFELLQRHLNEALTKPFLYQQALHRPYAPYDRSLDMHISHIRRKLQVLGYSEGRLETVWGIGYVLNRSEA